MHAAFAGEMGAFRAGPVVPVFEDMYAELVTETSRLKASTITHMLDSLVRERALALFLVAPKGLYAVNRHVDVTPNASTFELAQTKVSEDHWSRR